MIDSELHECADCSSKPGAPRLCARCLQVPHDSAPPTVLETAFRRAVEGAVHRNMPDTIRQLVTTIDVISSAATVATVTIIVRRTPTIVEAARAHRDVARVAAELGATSCSVVFA